MEKRTDKGSSLKEGGIVGAPDTGPFRRLRLHVTQLNGDGEKFSSSHGRAEYAGRFHNGRIWIKCSG